MVIALHWVQNQIGHVAESQAYVRAQQPQTPAFHGKMAHAPAFSKHFHLLLLNGISSFLMVYPIVCPAQIQLRSKSQNETISLAF